MKTITAAEARRLLSHLVDEVQESHEPIHIAGKIGTAVLISEEDWSSINETLYLLSIPGMRESIAKDLKKPIDKCSKEPGW